MYMHHILYTWPYSGTSSLSPTSALLIIIEICTCRDAQLVACLKAMAVPPG